MQRTLMFVLLLLVPSVLWATADQTTAALDQAHEALAQGRPGAAAATLRQALRRTDDEASAARLRCLLGVAWLADGSPSRAEAVLNEVGLEQPCGARAGFLRARALLALGRPADASGLYAEIGGPRLGPDRDAATAEALAEIAAELLADPDRGTAQALDILGWALDLRLAPEGRRQIARDLADRMVDEDLAQIAVAPRVCGALIDALRIEDDDADRLRAAAVCTRGVAVALLAPLDRSPEVLGTLARRTSGVGADYLAAAALSGLEGEAHDRARSALAEARVVARRLDALALMGEGEPDDLRRSAELLAAAGRGEEAIARLDRHLQDHPADPFRREVIDRRAVLVLDLARRAMADADPEAALGWYDDFLTRHPIHPEASLGAWEAGVAAHRAGRPDEARRRWSEALPRFSGEQDVGLAVQSLADLLAIEDGDPDGAFALLRRLAPRYAEAYAVTDALVASDLWIDTDVAADGRGTRVRLGARNLEQIEMRLHRIDAEAYVRAGQHPGALRSLDVAVVAPDRTWTVAVPEGPAHAEVVFEVQVPTPGPGLYAVTAGSDEEEAQVLVLAGGLTLAAQAVGGDLAVAAFRNGRPVSGARIVAVSGDRSEEGRTDRQGLWRTDWIAQQETVILGLAGGAPALLELDTLHTSEVKTGLTVHAELERPLALPGDRLGFRAIARRGDQPVRGAWTLWFEHRGTALSPIEATSNASGILVVDLPVPPVGTDGAGRASDLYLMGAPPGEAVPIRLVDLSVAADVPPVRLPSVEMVGTDAVVSVHGRHGEPVADIPLLSRDGDRLGTTDTSGRVVVPGPAEGIPYALGASIAGNGVVAVDQRMDPDPPDLEVRTDQDRLRPGEAAEVRVLGEGAVVLQLFRRVANPETPRTVNGPWTMDPLASGPRGWTGFRGSMLVPSTTLDLVSEQQVEAVEAGTAVDLGPLDPGAWRVAVISRDGVASSLLDLEVMDAGIRVVGAQDVDLGESLRLGVEGSAALVTVSADRLLWAGVRTPGGRATVPVASDWGPRVAVTALTGDGEVHQRHLEVDPDLDVVITTTPLDGGQVAIRASVRDGAGRPVRAQVALAAWDLRLEDHSGPAQGIEPRDLVAEVPAQIQTFGQSTPWEDGDTGRPIAGALRDEAQRESDREKAQRAQSGMFSDNRLVEVLGQKLLITEGASLSSFGAGGAGYGSGGLSGGVAGGVGGGVLGGVRPNRAPGVRTRTLWRVMDTGANGVAEGILDGAPAHYRVRATALSANAAGSETIRVRTDDRLWMIPHVPAPGAPGDLAFPTVTVVNGTAEAITTTLTGPDGTEPLVLAAGEATTRSVGPPRGPSAEVLTITAGEATADWGFAPARHAVGVTTAAIGPMGQVPVEALALQPDPDLSIRPWRYAARGRAALAALTVTDTPALRRAVRDARDILRIERRRPTPADASEAVLFLAELRDAGRFPVVQREIEEEAELLQQVATVEAGVWAALARARAGLPVDPDLLAFLRGADLSPDDAGRFALALATLGEVDEAMARKPDDLWGALTERALGHRVDRDPWRAAGPPPVGDPARADWIAWMGQARAPRRGGMVSVQASGSEVGLLDTTVGGTISVVADRDDVAVSAPGVVIWTAPAPPQPPETPGTEHFMALRVAQHLGGDPMRRSIDMDWNPSTCNPCVVRVGEAVRLSLSPRPGWTPTGLRRDPAERRVLWAEVPGTFVLHDLPLGSRYAREDLTVEVVADGDLSPLHSIYAMERSRVRGLAGLDPELPDLTDRPYAIGDATRIALDHALLSGDDDAIVDQFQRLVAVQPGAALELADVGRVAVAMMQTDRHADAVRVWQAGLDAAFVAEAGRLDGVDAHVGTLAAAKLVRDAALRYPDGPGVGEALYLLPSRLRAMADGPLDSVVAEAGISGMDLRLTAAAWDREFLALYPDHPRAPAAGLRLGRALLTLGAPLPSATWARAVAAAHPEDPLVDALTYLRALALTEAGGAGAEGLLTRLVEEPFPDPRGALGPSAHRGDAQLVLGRLFEARGDYADALAAYTEIQRTNPEAGRSASALSAKHVEVPTVVRVPSGESARLQVVAQGVDTLAVRAYAIDLRTIFLRDGGLGSVQHMSVAGVSPSWSGTRRLGLGPFPEDRTIGLPLSGPGAWLVHLEGDGVWATTLVVRSALALAIADDGRIRRLTVRRGALSEPGIEVRALGNGGVVAKTTDVRGVAEVPSGSPVIVFDGPHVAFTTPEVDAPARSTSPAPRSSEPSLPLGMLDQRLDQEQVKDQDAYRKRFSRRASEAMSLEML